VRYRYISIALCLMSLIPAIMGTANLRAATKMAQDLPEDHPVQAIFNIFSNEFDDVTGNYDLVTVQLVWGIKGMDRSGLVEIYSPGSTGKVVWDETFNLDAQTQQHIK